MEHSEIPRPGGPLRRLGAGAFISLVALAWLGCGNEDRRSAVAPAQERAGDSTQAGSGKKTGKEKAASEVRRYPVTLVRKTGREANVELVSVNGREELPLSTGNFRGAPSAKVHINNIQSIAIGQCHYEAPEGFCECTVQYVNRAEEKFYIVGDTNFNLFDRTLPHPEVDVPASLIKRVVFKRQ